MSEQWQCSVCGHIHKGGAPPTNCPTCGAPFTAFQRREADPRARFRGVEIAYERSPGFRYVIIGNSAAGRSAARAIQALDEDGRITIISDDPAPFYMRPLLPDLIGGMDRDRVFGVASDYAETGTETMKGESAVGIDLGSSQVTCSGGAVVPFDALLFATGSEPVHIPWPGSDTEGIMYLRTLAEAEQVMKLARRAKRAVVVGGGFLGLEFVRALVALGLEVTQLIRGTGVAVPAIDERAAGLLQKALEDAGVTVALQEEVESFESAKGRVRAVNTSAGRAIECDLVGVAVGARPRVELAQEAGLAVDRGILVDEAMTTSAPNVYAAGDVAQALDVSWREQRVNTSWRNAHEQGELAGVAMAGGDVAYAGSLAANYQQVQGLPFCALGIANPEDGDSHDVQWDLDEASRTYRKTVERDGRLVGAILVGDLGPSAGFETAIREQTAATDAPETPATAPAPVSEQAPPETIRVEPAAAQGESDMRKMTEQNISASFAGESQAHMKYLNFAKKAEEEGKTNVARLFRAASFSEQVHASEQLEALGGLGSTGENLAGAIGGEGFEVDEMYPAYMAVAIDQDEALAQRCFRHAIEAEKVHRELYERAKKAVDAGGDASIDEIWVCPVCGFTMEGAPPDECPVCTTAKSEFVKF